MLEAINCMMLNCRIAYIGSLSGLKLDVDLSVKMVAMFSIFVSSFVVSSLAIDSNRGWDIENSNDVTYKVGHKSFQTRKFRRNSAYKACEFVQFVNHIKEVTLLGMNENFGPDEPE